MKKLSLKNVGDQNLHLRASSSQRAPFFVFFIFLHPKTTIRNTTKSPQKYLGTKKPQNLGTKYPKNRREKTWNREINYPCRTWKYCHSKKLETKIYTSERLLLNAPFFLSFFIFLHLLEDHEISRKPPNVAQTSTEIFFEIN